jgi:hypothetical protein
MKGDDRTPYTQNWNFIVSQQMPWKSLLEVQYSGNRTRDALIAGNGTNIPFLSNLNKIPVGALFGPDPVTGVNYWAQSCAAGGCKNPDSKYLQDYRPYANYGSSFNLITHGSYSNYNALMVTWHKQRGPVLFTTNYSFSKVLGIRDGQTNNGNGDGQVIDTYNMRSNYGPLAYDHTHIFNVAYVISMPNPIHDNAFLAYVVNGWQFAGVSQWQSGAPIQPNSEGVMNVQWDGVSNQSILGTDSVRLVPLLSCDPRKGLSSGQYFNPACFTGPQTGSNGTIIWPYIKGPGYMNHDLSLYKNFKVNERHSVQLRMNAFNFLNHPLPQFRTGSANDLTLNLKATQIANPANPTAPTYRYTQANPELTGKPTYTVGRRVMEFAIKYEF